MPTTTARIRDDERVNGNGIELAASRFPEFNPFFGATAAPTLKPASGGFASTPVKAAPAPTLTGKNAIIDEGQKIAASTLIASIVNPGGATTTQYAFTDAGGDNGALALNGVVLTAGKVYDLTAAQLAELSYIGGASSGTDHVTVQSYDGAAWSAAATVTVTTAAPPTVTTKNASVVAGKSIAESALIASVADPAGDAISEYAFEDSGSDGGKLLLNGQALSNGAWHNLTPAQLAQLTYVGGTGAGDDSVSIKVFDGHVWSTVSVAAITQSAATILNQLTDPGIEGDVASLMSNNSLSYASMLKILQDTATGGMTAGKFSTLQTLASMLDTTGGVSTSTYVKDIATSLIDGDAANANWTGGASGSVALGNLSATTSATKVGELIGKWFLGTDLPSMNVAPIGITNPGSTYQLTSNSLYGSSGAPVYTDVNQGLDGDCYFVSSIADVALQDPTAIESMITNNGNGTYGVRFFVSGKADYVTVNGQLPTMPGNNSWANGSNLEFANGSVLWPELIEKAYAQLNAEPNAPHGGQLNAASNSYAGVSGGSGYALTEITGQAVGGYSLSTSTSSATLMSDSTQLAAAFSAGQEMLVGTSNSATGDLVADHMFEVIGCNPTAEMLTLHNPWGTAAATSLPMTFNESLASLAANNCTIFMTTGKPTA